MICFAHDLSSPDRKSLFQKPCAEKQDILAQAQCHVHMVTWLLCSAGCHLACMKDGRVKFQLSAPIHLDIPNIWSKKQVVIHFLVNLIHHFSVSLLTCGPVNAGHILCLHSIYLHRFSVHLMPVINVSKTLCK